MKKLQIISIFLLPVIFFTACKDEETPDPVNEEELITSIVLTFENTADFTTTEFAFRDIDGPGGNAPTEFDTIRLQTGTYLVTVSILNESESPALDLTTEIEEEAVDHQFFYTVDEADITFTYNDTDANGLPVGLDMTAVVGAGATIGTVTITLKHQPGIKDDNITTGETDVEIAFVTALN